MRFNRLSQSLESSESIKLTPIKPYFKFNEMCISKFNIIIKSILK